MKRKITTRRQISVLGNKSQQWKVRFYFRIVLLLCCLILAVSLECSQNLFHPKKQVAAIPRLKDSLSIDTLKKANPLFYEHEINNLLYIGPWKASIRVDQTIPILKNDQLAFQSERQKDDLAIHIDTSQQVHYKLDCIGYSKQSSTIEYSNLPAYPVVFSNLGSNQINLGVGHNIQLYLEALDKDGHFKLIKEYTYSSSGTGAGQLNLNPGEIAITSFPIPEGNFITTLRVKTYMGTSNEIQVNIDPKIFEQH